MAAACVRVSATLRDLQIDGDSALVGRRFRLFDSGTAVIRSGTGYYAPQDAAQLNVAGRGRLR